MFGSEGPKIKPKKGSKVTNSQIPSLRLRRGGVSSNISVHLKFLMTSRILM